MYCNGLACILNHNKRITRMQISLTYLTVHKLFHYQFSLVSSATATHKASLQIHFEFEMKSNERIDKLEQLPPPVITDQLSYQISKHI